MKQLAIVLILMLFVIGCRSVSFDEPGYVWEDWDLEQQSE